MEVIIIFTPIGNIVENKDPFRNNNKQPYFISVLFLY